MNRELVLEILAKTVTDFDFDKQQDDEERENYKKQRELLKEFAGDKNKVKQKLLGLVPAEIGGQVALAGFFYQFLVTIEYIIELLEGKWDFVAVELHEDIIVGKENVVKFVQVKTSQDPHKAISKTDLIKRTSNKKDPTIQYNDSWVDKLLLKAKYFPRSRGYKTMFELVSSYYITGDATSPYSQNKNFDTPINDKDQVWVTLSKAVYTKDDHKPFNYKQECEEDLRELLSRFYLCKRPDLMDIEYYKSHISKKFSEQIGAAIGLTDDHLNWIVGYLMDKCRMIGNTQALYIDQNEAQEILQKVHDQVMGVAGQTTRQYESLYVIQEVFDRLYVDVGKIDRIDARKELLEYQEHLQQWLKKGRSIRELINRYFDGREISDAFRINAHERYDRLLELFRTGLLLILIHEDLIRITEHHKSLLVTQIKNQKISFLSLSIQENLKQGIDKINNIFGDISNSLDVIIDPPHKLILQGEYDGNEDPVKRITIIDPRPQTEQIPNNTSLKEVPILMDIVPGANFYKSYKQIYMKGCIDEFRNHFTKEFDWLNYDGE